MVQSVNKMTLKHIQDVSSPSKTCVLLPPPASAQKISRPTFQKLEELEHDNLHLRLLVNTVGHVECWNP